MKSLLTLFLTVLDEVGDYCSVDTSLDRKTVERRFGNEGLRFLTVDLPQFGSGLERALDRGTASPDLFPGFRCRQSLPVLFGGFLDLIFERTSGALLDDPSIEAIRSLRQLTLILKKIELQCSPDLIQAAFDRYVECDSEVREWEESAGIDQLIEFHQMSSLLFSRVFQEVNEVIRDFNLKPRHGGGATADRLFANQKFEMPEWTDRLEAVMPYWRYATTRGYAQAVYDRVIFREPGAERPVKVVHVPKTQLTPRIIAEEPTCMQYAQQGVALALKEAVSKSYLEQLIGTTHQEPNQLLAESGSLNGDLATLDLSEASDRVSNLLVMTMTANFPHLHDAVQASRSLTADVPGHGVIPLARFASMGSALTFPLESMVFLTVVMLGLRDAQLSTFSRQSDFIRLSGSVRIYGDDIIVPVGAVDAVVRRLEAFGFKVNSGKSFWTGRFRESCGKEYYSGEDVTLCRIRRPLPSSQADVAELVSAVSFRNHAYRRGLWKTAAFMDDLLSKLIPMPAVAETSPALGRLSCLGYETQRISDKLHIPMVKGAVVRYRKRSSPIADDAALMKTLSWKPDLGPRGPFNPVETEDDHLQYAGRPDASSINIRWLPAY